MVPILNIPILSVVLMLLAGILLGHLIWYRDRSDDEAALAGLRGENNDLQAALQDQKKAYVELESERDSQRKEWERLKATNQQLEHAQQEMDHERALLNSELARLQQLKDQAFHDLDQERQQRRSLQEALAQAEEHATQLGAATEQLQQQVATFQAERDELDQAAQAKLQQQDATVEQLTLECDAARQEVAEHRDLLARVQAELQAREEDLQSLREERDELTAQVEELRTSHEQLQRKMSHLDQLVTQRDEAMSRATSAEETNKHLQEELASHQQSSQRLKDEHHELVQSHASLQRAFRAEKEKHDDVAAMLLEARSRVSEMEAEITRNSIVLSQRDEAKRREQACNEMIVKLQRKAEERQNELDLLRGNFAETAAQLGSERHQREHLQHVLVERDTQINSLQERVNSLQQSQEKLASLRQELKSAQLSLAEQRETAQSLGAQLEAAAEELAHKSRAFSELQASADEISTQNQKLREQAEILRALRGEHESVKHMLEDQSRELNDVRQQLASESERYSQAAKSLKIQTDTVLRLQKEIRQQASWRQRHEELESKFQENAELLRSVTAERDQYLMLSENAESRIKQLESKAQANEDTIRQLRRERVAILTRVRQPAVFPFTGGATRSAEGAGGRMRHDEVLGMVYTQPPKRRDDLKRISGIAQVTEKKLNAFGVYTYRQIMEWDSVAVNEFSKLLSFRDRIQRDDWVSQARHLHHEHYGRAA